MCEQWLLEELSWDVWPNDGDGIVNFFDWGDFASEWKITNYIAQLSDFADQRDAQKHFLFLGQMYRFEGGKNKTYRTVTNARPERQGFFLCLFGL